MSAKAGRARSVSKIPLPLPLLLVGVALVAAGCGSSSKTTSSAAPATSTPEKTTSTAAGGGESGGAAQSLTIAANSEGQLKFDKSTLSAHAGKVTISFANMAPLEHNFTVANSSEKVEGATPTFQGGTKTLTLNLKAGTYKFFCTVPGHRQAGMEGTLNVS